MRWIADDVFFVFRAPTPDKGHVVSWKDRGCENCHYYAENRLPCKHLYAIWIHHKDSGIPGNGTGGRDVMTAGEAYRHMFGKCYFITSLHEAIQNVALVLPVSLDSIPTSTQSGCELRLLKPNVSRGRTQVRRISSSCDSFRTGAKPKRPKSKIAVPSAENNVEENIGINLRGESAEVVENRELFEV